MAPRSAEEIAYLYGARVFQRGPAAAMARVVTEAYENRIVVPVTELAKDEGTAAANLILQGIDHWGQLISGVAPNVKVPADRPGFDTSERKALTKRRALLGWWEANGLDGAYSPMRGRRGRQYVAHGSAPVVLRPDPKLGIPMWEVRDALATFPAETSNPDDVAPPDCIFAFRRSWRWLYDRWPDQLANLRRPADDHNPDTVYDCLEYVDDDRCVLVVLSGGCTDPVVRGESAVIQPYRWPSGTVGGDLAVAVVDTPNRAGMCPAVVPGRVGLTNNRRGQFDGAINMYRIRAALWALWIIAARRNVFAETWVSSSDPNQPAQVVVAAEPESGVVGEIQGGKIDVFRPPLDVGGLQAIDRLMEQERIEGGVPADMTGLSSTNIRTARRGSQILSATIDDSVGEAQAMFARAAQHENRVAIAIAKGYFGSARKSFYVSHKGAAGVADYIPNRDFETDTNIVEYPMAGATMESLTITGGQMMGLKALSREDFMELHPLVRDVEETKRRLVAEALEDAGLSALQAQAAQGQLTPPDWAAISRYVKQGMPVDEAVDKVHREAQQRQSPNVEPVPAGAPEAQPGLAAPGAGAEAGVAPAGPSPGGLAQLLGSLNMPAQVQVQ